MIITLQNHYKSPPFASNTDYTTKEVNCLGAIPPTTLEVGESLLNHVEQQRNKRTNHFLTYNGKTRTIAEWGEITGILPATIQHRICRDGWSVEDALLTPPRKRRKKEG